MFCFVTFTCEKEEIYKHVCGLTCGIDHFDEMGCVRLFEVSNKGGFTAKGKVVEEASASLLPAVRTTELAVVDVVLCHVTPENLH